MTEKEAYKNVSQIKIFPRCKNVNCEFEEIPYQIPKKKQVQIEQLEKKREVFRAVLTILPRLEEDREFKSQNNFLDEIPQSGLWRMSRSEIISFRGKSASDGVEVGKDEIGFKIQSGELNTKQDKEIVFGASRFAKQATRDFIDVKDLRIALKTIPTEKQVRDEIDLINKEIYKLEKPTTDWRETTIKSIAERYFFNNPSNVEISDDYILIKDVDYEKDVEQSPLCWLDHQVLEEGVWKQSPYTRGILI